MAIFKNKMIIPCFSNGLTCAASDIRSCKCIALPVIILCACDIDIYPHPGKRIIVALDEFLMGNDSNVSVSAQFYN